MLSVSSHELDVAGGAVRRPSAVTRVMLTNFRSYPALTLDCGPQSVVLTGPNGAGKTNILEALSMLSPGRGLRGASLSQLSRRQAGEPEDAPGGPWAVSVSAATPEGPAQLGAGFMPGQGGGPQKRLIRIDGQAAASAADLVPFLQFVWLTPAQDRLFLDAASDRRRFFDRLVAGFNPRHASLWSSYEKAMRERLAVLRSGQASQAWLSSIERIMAEHAVALAASRLDGLAHLAPLLGDRDTNPVFPSAEARLDGEVEAWLQTAPAILAEDRFADLLAASRATDAEAGRTKHGPHATDFSVRHRAKGRDARNCSTGEQKSLMIRIVLAGAELAARRNGVSPILLLDEIAAHLDEHRRRGLFDALAQLGAQAWFTGTEDAAFAGLGARAQTFHVAHGTAAAYLEPRGQIA